MLLGMKNCICGNDLTFEKCCGRFINGDELPASAVELMRSRYSAYVLKNGEYLYNTCSKSLQDPKDIEAIKTHNIEWLGLKILEKSDYEVTFMAYYREDNKIGVMKEHSFFIQEDGRLKYDRGEMLNAEISRNEPCPCGSGKKYKRCCG